jgi:hypothetical protein
MSTHSNEGAKSCQMIHHSALSFRKLTSMKIVDRSSCYIVGIKKDMADKALLAKYELFGQFGTILSIRIIQDKDPCEVYIRFSTQRSAVNAINWCNSDESLFTNAKHGYQKYCIKFINGQNCKRSNINCPNRHSWADTKDILTFKNSRLVPNAVGTVGACSPSEEDDRMAPLPLAQQQAARVPQRKHIEEKMRHDQEMRALQNQFMVLQKQYSKQSRFVNDLVAQMNVMQRDNMEMSRRLNLTHNHRWLQQQQNAQRAAQMQQHHAQMQQQMQQQQQQQRQFLGPMAKHYGPMPRARAQKPFVVNSPELNLMASAYDPLPESANTPLPDSVMNGALTEIVDQVIQSDSSHSSSTFD